MSNEVNKDAAEKAEAPAVDEVKNETTTETPVEGAQPGAAATEAAQGTAAEAATDTPTESATATSTDSESSAATEKSSDNEASAGGAESNEAPAVETPVEQLRHLPLSLLLLRQLAVQRPLEVFRRMKCSEDGGDMDFGAMLEQFEQDQVTYHAQASS